MEVQQQQQQQQQQLEEEEVVDDEMEQEGLIARKRSIHQTPFSTTNPVDGQEEEQNDIKVKVDEEDQKQGEYCVYYDTDKGYESGLHHESSTNGIDSAAHPKENTSVTTNHNQENGKGLYPIISNQNGQHQKLNEISEVNEVINKETESSDINEVINKETESSDINEVIKDGEDEIAEFDVETVIKKQETHDLFCPNCNSCITKRVILRKRKRRIPALSEDAKRNKPETSVQNELNAVSSNNEAQPPASDESDHQREPDVFRCLSCFSIFMPTGTGFKLFRMFGNKSDEESNQHPQKEAGVKRRWFSSIFKSDKVEQSNNVASSSLDGRIEDVHDQLLTSYQIDSDAKSDYPGMYVIRPPANNNNNNENNNVEPTENDISSLQHDGLRLVVPPNVGSLIIDNSHMNQELDVSVQMNTPGSDEKGGANSSFSPPASTLERSNLVDQMKDLQFPTNVTINGKEQKMDKDKVASTDNVDGQITVQNNAEIHLEEPLKDVLTDKQTTIVQDLKKQWKHYSGSQQGAAATATLTGGRSVEIIKSIVYGGLMESIASLSVVSSAVGANAATLNVLALGLANIFGGLFVIGHDLWDLKAEQTSGPSEEDRYQQFLGRRENFTIHVVVCLLSYLVFGFLPPVVYGFSFRESNDRDLKLLMVAVASIICIMILAAAKAYVQSKPYFKTITYYLTFVFMVSGASFLFGDLIARLLEKIDIFHSGSVENLISIHGGNSKPALATY
ncbi:hypothetical protein OSB04_018889 [Centaurea solstitialis]|uniref:Membrane protein of ER body-like protein n=1 Tax=Centaurea solstitialis TaxID=347529 RepID=A0AA38T2M2_9ASTR|nr:hypothetical protein OSB04_018889 [Centaurea solstitialis]